MYEKILAAGLKASIWSPKMRKKAPRRGLFLTCIGAVLAIGVVVVFAHIYL